MKISELTPKDIGQWVHYVPDSDTCDGHCNGKLKYWNDRFIFVVFGCVDDENWEDNRWLRYTAQAVNPEDLERGKNGSNS